MSEAIYRDALLGLRARVAELAVRIAEREADVTVDLAHFMPHEMTVRLAELRATRCPPGDSFEELSRAEERDAAYVALLDEVLALVPALERELRALPKEAPALARMGRRVSAPLFGGEMSETLTTIGAVLARVVARYDPSARVDALDDFAFASRLFAMQSPLALLVECFVNRERPLEPRVQVATSVPRGASPVRVVPETWARSLVRSLGLGARYATGDAEFDGRFVVEGDYAQASRILSRPVRASLLAIARDDVPEVHVDDGRALVRWSFEPTERALDAAFFVLGRIRAADVSLRLTR